MTERESQQFIFGCIFLLANKLQLLGDKVTRELTLKQWFLLNILQQMDNKLPNYNEIANAVGTSRQNVSKMLSVLSDKGMVDLYPSKVDQRAIRVSLTEKALDYFSTKEDDGNNLLEQLFADVNPATLEQTAYLLNHLLQKANLFLEEENQ
jgi:DNA-binding MarR family transcriptional regulator